MNRQYLACSFTEGGRLYTYHYDGDTVGVGDNVLVAAHDSPGAHVTVTVEKVVDKPVFPTKPIIGLAPAENESLNDEASE